MKEKSKNISYEMQENGSKYWKNVKNTVKKLHKESKSDVPVYLDSLKKGKEIKEATRDNEFLKYML